MGRAGTSLVHAAVGSGRAGMTHGDGGVERGEGGRVVEANHGVALNLAVLGEVRDDDLGSGRAGHGSSVGFHGVHAVVAVHGRGSAPLVTVRVLVVMVAGEQRVVGARHHHVLVVAIGVIVGHRVHRVRGGWELVDSELARLGIAEPGLVLIHHGMAVVHRDHAAECLLARRDGGGDERAVGVAGGIGERRLGVGAVVERAPDAFAFALSLAHRVDGRAELCVFLLGLFGDIAGLAAVVLELADDKFEPGDCKNGKMVNDERGGDGPVSSRLAM